MRLGSSKLWGHMLHEGVAQMSMASLLMHCVISFSTYGLIGSALWSIHWRRTSWTWVVQMVLHEAVTVRKVCGCGTMASSQSTLKDNSEEKSFQWQDIGQDPGEMGRDAAHRSWVVWLAGQGLGKNTSGKFVSTTSGEEACRYTYQNGHLVCRYLWVLNKGWCQ